MFIVALLALLSILVLFFGGFAYVVFRIMEAFGTADDEAQQGYALRLRRDDGFREFSMEFASTDVPKAILRASFDLLWLDVLWAREGPISRNTRLDHLYGDVRRFDDVARTLAKLCRVDESALDPGRETPATVGELVHFVADLKSRQTADSRRLLRPRGIDGSLLRPALNTEQSNESLLRAVPPLSQLEELE